jgi:hypothetical protein
MSTSEHENPSPVERRDGASVFACDPDGVHVERRVDGVLT